MVLIYDIETKTSKNTPDPEKDELRFFGWLDTSTGNSGYLRENEIEQIQIMLKSYKIVVGFNTLNYDNPILERYGIDFKYIRVIDLYDVVTKRKSMMRLNLRSYSLASLAKHFNLQTKKQEQFDYSVLQKQEFSQEDISYIWDYLKTDLEATKSLWDYLDDYFSGFKTYLDQKYIDNYSYIASSGGALAYKAICSQANLVEEYNERSDNYKRYTGGYVILPKQDFYKGNIYLFDFTSLYPHMFMQANLYSHSCSCSIDKKWTGNEMFPDIKGQYCKKQPGIIEKVIERLFIERLQIKKTLETLKKNTPEYKEADRKQLSIKIIINTMYGISGSPIFKHVYNVNTASDCTYLARQCIKYAHKKFKAAGFEPIYGDTDSSFVYDTHNQGLDKLMKVKNDIMADLKASFPFPKDTFDMVLEHRIKRIFFFKKANGKFAKKFYIYLTDDNHVIVKGIQVVKSNCSLLSEKIFKEKILPFIKETGELKLKSSIIKQWIVEELEKDVGIAGYLLRTKDVDYYKNASQLQAQVSVMYGHGNHLVIPNYVYGAGLCLKYCTIDDFKNKNIHLSQIALDNVYSELDYFCDTPLVSRQVSRVEQVRIRKRLTRNNQLQLSQWY